MNQSFDSFGLFDPPSFFICNPDKSVLYSLGTVSDRKYMPRYNSLGTISFTAPAFVNGVATEYYDALQYRRLIYLEDLGYFMITEIDIEGDGVNTTKAITAESLEVELVTKKLTVFSGTFKFYDVLTPAPTLLGRILTYLPGWTIGSVDIALTSLYRTFDISDSTIYNFLMNEVETAYQCVFDFDTINKTISARAVSRAVTSTDIYLSFDNLIKNIKVKEITDELVTSLSVYGGGNLSINSVNPLGTDKIYNFDHFKSTEWMSQGLVDAITAWEAVVDANQAGYAVLLTTLQAKNQLLNTKEAELVVLQVTFDALEGVKSARIQQGLDLSAVNAQLAAQQLLINTKNAEIDVVEAAIVTTTAQLTVINTAVSFATNFTAAQLTELSPFVIGPTYSNINFIQTDIMSASAIQLQAQELYDQAVDVLAKISQPRYEFTVESANFIFAQEFQPFITQLALGASITLELQEGLYSYPVLLGFDLNYDDPTDFSLIFGNRLRLDNSSYILSDLFGQTVTSAINSTFNSEQWSSWNDNYKNDVSTFINSSLDAAVNNIVTGVGQNILINQNGIRVRKSTGTNVFSPNQLWMNNGVLAFSDDNFDTAKLALGQISTSSGSYFGLVAEVIVGNLIAGNQLVIMNENNTFLVDGSGATLTNATFTLTRDNGNNRIIIDPVTGIAIQKRVSSGSFVNQFYVDGAGNLIFSGNLSGASGTFTGNISARSGDIGGWHINDYGLYDDNGNYIRSNGQIQLGVLNINGSTGYFNGNFYAPNLIGKILGNQLKDIDADTITAGVIRGLEIYGCEIYWPGVSMTTNAYGWPTIRGENAITMTTPAGDVQIANNSLLINHKDQVDIFAGASANGKINLWGNIYSSGEMGVTGTYPVGTSTMRFKNGIMTATTLGVVNTIEGSTWILPDPIANTVSGIEKTYYAADSFSFGQIGQINSSGWISLASNTAIDGASGLVMCSSLSISNGSSGNFLHLGVAKKSGWSWTTKGLLYLATGGGMTHTPPSGTDVVAQVLGVATGYNEVFFNPSLVQVEMV